MNHLTKINYGNKELNELFQSLDVETKKKITKYPNSDVQINILKAMKNKELNDYFDSLSDAEQTQLEEFGLRDKYHFLKKMYEERLKSVKGPSNDNSKNDL
jgi:Mg/Co/Ni transporter MgtE